MFKKKTIDSFFKRKERNDEETQPMSSAQNVTSNLETDVENVDQQQQSTMPILEQLVQLPSSKFIRIGVTRQDEDIHKVGIIISINKMKFVGHI